MHDYGRNEAIDGHHRFGTMLINESNDYFGDFWIGSRIGCFAEPPLNRVRVSTFVRDDATKDLRRKRPSSLSCRLARRRQPLPPDTREAIDVDE
jgi:hypothetical protein